MLAGAATEVPCGVGVCSARAVAGVRVCMPVSQDIEQGWSRGLSHQEAPQAHGQEEAPQAAAQDARPAQEQEVAPPAEGGLRGPGGERGQIPMGQPGPVDGWQKWITGAGEFVQHPRRRNLRVLSADLVYDVPVLSDLARRSGHIRADPQEADEALAHGELVGVFPEGFKGTGKAFSERYRLPRFGRGGFAATARRAGVPIIPCAIVGAEEIYPMIANSRSIARLFRLPYFPVTPLFPWLGPIGAVPLPSNWIIEFCPPVPTDRSGNNRARPDED